LIHVTTLIRKAACSRACHRSRASRFRRRFDPAEWRTLLSSPITGNERWLARAANGHAAAHPELVIAVVNAASSDWAASRLAVAIERVAEALLVEEEAQRILPARELLRARP
jgi:hypothetical protein